MAERDCPARSNHSPSYRACAAGQHGRAPGRTVPGAVASWPPAPCSQPRSSARRPRPGARRARDRATSWASPTARPARVDGARAAPVAARAGRRTRRSIAPLVGSPRAPRRRARARPRVARRHRPRGAAGCDDLAARFGRPVPRRHAELALALTQDDLAALARDVAGVGEPARCASLDRSPGGSSDHLRAGAVTSCIGARIGRRRSGTPACRRGGRSPSCRMMRLQVVQ